MPWVQIISTNSFSPVMRFRRIFLWLIVLDLGTTAGYIKTWLMRDYCTAEKEEVCMPKYRLLFPFLLKDRIEGRAKRSNRGQLLPILLNSFKAHGLAVSGLAYIQKAQILIR